MDTKQFLLTICFFAVAFSACKQANKIGSGDVRPIKDTLVDFASQRESQLESLQRLKLDSIGQYLYNKYNLDPAIMFERFGKPVAAETSGVKNRHTNDRDFIYKYQLRDASVAIYHATGSSRYLLSVLATSNMSQLSGFGIITFMSPDSLRNLLGKENTIRDDEPKVLNLEYEIGEASNSLSFIFHNSKLDSIVFIPYLD